jgi:hypothetical protein
MFFFSFLGKKLGFWMKISIFVSINRNYLKQAAMGLEEYESKSNKAQTTFDFISEGSKGQILKSVRFVKIKGVRNVYNLAFGDKRQGSNRIDDRVVSDNQDRDKVLATVAGAVIAFTNHYPKANIFFRGSTDSRTRLYQMAIAKYYEELSNRFAILGLTENGWVPFEKNITYIAFLINCKK